MTSSPAFRISCSTRPMLRHASSLMLIARSSAACSEIRAAHCVQISAPQSLSRVAPAAGAPLKCPIFNRAPALGLEVQAIRGRSRLAECSVGEATENVKAAATVDDALRQEIRRFVKNVNLRFVFGLGIYGSSVAELLRRDAALDTRRPFGRLQPNIRHLLGIGLELERS